MANSWDKLTPLAVLVSGVLTFFACLATIPFFLIGVRTVIHLGLLRYRYHTQSDEQRFLPLYVQQFGETAAAVRLKRWRFLRRVIFWRQVRQLLSLLITGAGSCCAIAGVLALANILPGVTRARLTWAEVAAGCSIAAYFLAALHFHLTFRAFRRHAGKRAAPAGGTRPGAWIKGAEKKRDRSNYY